MFDKQSWNYEQLKPSLSIFTIIQLEVTGMEQPVLGCSHERTLARTSNVQFSIISRLYSLPTDKEDRKVEDMPCDWQQLGNWVHSVDVPARSRYCSHLTQTC